MYKFNISDWADLQHSIRYSINNNLWVQLDFFTGLFNSD